jgi:DNA-binding transcriptional regulator YdaS (Cro superfamily)
MNAVTLRCIEAVGGIAKLAALLRVRHQSFYSWRRVPAERVLEVERVTGISRHELRPDLYPPPTDTPSKATAA